MKRSILVLAILLTACLRNIGQPQTGQNVPSVIFPRSNIVLRSGNAAIALNVELAQTQEQHERGLMYRTSLPTGSGMMFIFEDEAIRTFWMKNTLIPLDIVFLNTQGSVVSTAHMEPCTADPCVTTNSPVPARFALELSSGFVSKYSIDSSWKMGKN